MAVAAVGTHAVKGEEAANLKSEDDPATVG
jgi:hypothetical protein